MNYRLHRDGQDLGSFSLDELRRRREAGELNGSEFVWCEGMADWEGLDSVLAQSEPAASLPLPPPIPVSTQRDGLSPVIMFAIICGVCLFVVGLTFVAYKASKSGRSILPVVALNPSRSTPPRSPAYIAASKPIVWTSNTWTAADVTRRKLQFQQHLWVEDYQLHGDHTKACDALALQFLKAQVAQENGGDADPNPPDLSVLAAKLTRDPSCTDSLVWAALIRSAHIAADALNRVQRALPATNNAIQHLAYARFFANLVAADTFGRQSRGHDYDSQALVLFKQCFTDGSFRPGDQLEIAELFLNGQGGGFYHRNEADLSTMTSTLGSQYEWLGLVLEGQDHIDLAWKARGGGYADSVTTAGWQSFASELAAARRCLTHAWELHPEYPTAPGLMIYVSLGDSNITEMRLWFDRAVAAQIDYPLAWSNLRWGLRPMWYGDPQSALALGVTAVNTGRFDTAVPKELINVLNDLQEESPKPTLAGLYGQPDVWPSVAKMYEGYIAAGPDSRRDDLRNTYCELSYFAGKYDITRKQLEALDWKPDPSKMTNSALDFSLMPLEVAARTGPSAAQVTRAESSRNQGNFADAARIYANLLAGGGMDDRTRQFAACRSAALNVEQKLQSGEWVDFLPQSDDDPNWDFARGYGHMTNGELYASNGTSGYFYFSHARVGRDFEVKGEFEVIQTPKHAFKAVLVMGTPEPVVNLASSHWYAVIMQRAVNGSDAIAISRGLGTPAKSSPAPLNETNNTFDITLHGDLCSAIVNGQAFPNADALQAVVNSTKDFFLGVAGSTQLDDGVIHYRKLQVRKLPPNPPGQ